jgi:hypothetical protein
MPRYPFSSATVPEWAAVILAFLKLALGLVPFNPPTPRVVDFP